MAVMPVYVDDMREPFRGMYMCHMLADSTEELLAMVDAIGVERRHIQNAGTTREHFDVSLHKRRLAVKAGAIEINIHITGLMLWEREGRELTAKQKRKLASVRNKARSLFDD